jgi:radical SAM protein with 4Fe4S-binding SPASM domain
VKNALARARRRLVPASVLLTITHRCQLACSHCYEAEHGASAQELSFEEWVQLFDELALLGTLELTFTGGEALLRPDALLLMAEARRRQFAITVFTNGGPITPEVARRLRELRVMGVEVSLHAAHAALHDGLVGRRGAFARAVRAIELLDAEGVPVLVKSNVLRCNALEVLALEALFAARPRVRFLSDVLVHARDDGRSLAAQRPTGEQVEAYFDTQVARLEAVEPLLARLHAVPDGYLERDACGAGRTFASVQPNGDVLPCVHTPGLKLGNLREASFSALWLSSEAVRRMRAVTVARFAECAGCEYRHVCAKCPALSLSESGELTGHSRQVCDRTKAFWGAVKRRAGGTAPAPAAAAEPARRSFALPVIA